MYGADPDRALKSYPELKSSVDILEYAKAVSQPDKKSVEIQNGTVETMKQRIAAMIERGAFPPPLQLDAAEKRRVAPYMGKNQEITVKPKTQDQDLE